MENALHHTPKEDTVAEAKCSKCGESIYIETLTVGTEVAIPHRSVSGSFMQFIDSDGNPFGPVWAYCESCGTDPMNNPDVISAYEKLKEKHNATR